MEVEVAKRSGVQRSQEEIISILEECKKSKLNVKEFVKTKGIHEATYYNWRNKYGGKKGKRKMGKRSIPILPPRNPSISWMAALSIRPGSTRKTSNTMPGTA
jgi:hypothetical protein